LVGDVDLLISHPDCAFGFGGTNGQKHRMILEQLIDKLHKQQLLTDGNIATLYSFC
jgi:hypothetical protein